MKKLGILITKQSTIENKKLKQTQTIIWYYKIQEVVTKSYYFYRYIVTTGRKGPRNWDIFNITYTLFVNIEQNISVINTAFIYIYIYIYI